MKLHKLYQLHLPKWVVACWCYPDKSPRLACKSLRRDIRRFPEIRRQLNKLGYLPRQRHFTFAQAKVLNAHYCGEGEQVSATELLWQSAETNVLSFQ